MCKRLFVLAVALIVTIAVAHSVGAEPPYVPTNDGLCALYEKLSIEPDDPSLCSWELTERIIFVTAGEYKPQVDFVGVDEADNICQLEANASGLKGKFKAWISDTSFSSAPSARFEHSMDPYVRPDGVKVALDWEGLASGSGHKAPINVQADGTELDSNDPGYVWTNVNISGEPSQQSPENVCDHWTDVDQGYRGIVGTAQVFDDYRWTDKGWLGCDSDLRLYCVQQAN